MALNKKEAQELLQVVDDSYMRTAKLKAAYEDYQRLLKKQNNWNNGTSKIMPKEEENRKIQEYKGLFAQYEINIKNKNYWYEGSYASFPTELKSSCDKFKENLDPLKAFLKKCKWKGAYFNKSDYSVEGNVYLKNKTYYLSFDGSVDIWDDFLTADLGILLNNFAFMIEKAYSFYNTAMRCIPALSPGNVVFLGHSLGGALAGTLAAAIYLNAFNDKNKFTPSRFQKESPEPLGANIRTVTFNAPQMGGFFDKVIFDLGTGVIAIKTTRIPEARLKQVNVTSVGMEDDYVFNLHGRKEGENQIGADMLVLSREDGQLQKILNNSGVVEELLETEKRLDKSNIFTYLKAQVKDKVFWHFISTLALALYENPDDSHMA
ncbi:MAG: hypothetical protein FWH52_07155 [Synergistaceae bacterium]|nr:hypothetical protein [Synergistaceae bacterium]